MGSQEGSRVKRGGEGGTRVGKGAAYAGWRLAPVEVCRAVPAGGGRSTVIAMAGQQVSATERERWHGEIASGGEGGGRRLNFLPIEVER